MERIRVAQLAPAHAPSGLPASRLSTMLKCGASTVQGTATSRAGRAGEHDDEAQRLVDDDGLQRRNPEQHDQQRKAELGTAQADHAAEYADTGPAKASGRLSHGARPDGLRDGRGAYPTARSGCSRR